MKIELPEWLTNLMSLNIIIPVALSLLVVFALVIVAVKETKFGQGVGQIVSDSGKTVLGTIGDILGGIGRVLNPKSGRISIQTITQWLGSLFHGGVGGTTVKPTPTPRPGGGGTEETVTPERETTPDPKLEAATLMETAKAYWSQGIVESGDGEDALSYSLSAQRKDRTNPAIQEMIDKCRKIRILLGQLRKVEPASFTQRLVLCAQILEMNANIVEASEAQAEANERKSVSLLMDNLNAWIAVRGLVSEYKDETEKEASGMLAGYVISATKKSQGPAGRPGDQFTCSATSEQFADLVSSEFKLNRRFLHDHANVSVDVGVTFKLKDAVPDEPPWTSTTYKKAVATPEPTPGPTVVPTPSPTPTPKCVQPAGTTITILTGNGKATMVVSEGTLYFVLGEEKEPGSDETLVKVTCPGAAAPFFVPKTMVLECACP